MESMNIRDILSDREFEVMVLVSSGLYNKEVADKLKCEECTIKKHLQHIFEKMRVQNRTEATVKFFRLGGMLILPNENQSN
jgi:DNA-binding NarL/FixJ family response regulator